MRGKKDKNGTGDWFYVTDITFYIKKGILYIAF